MVKYQMEKRRLMNFLVVRTKLAVRLVHSVVNTNTEKMQTYWRTTLAARWRTMTGTVISRRGTRMPLLAIQTRQCLTMSWARKVNSGSGRAWV